MPGERNWTRSGLSDGSMALLASELPASRLWSLLMDVLERRAGARQPNDLAEQWSRDGFTRIAAVDQRTLVELDRRLFAACPAFEAVELSPLAPLGASSVLGRASQNKVVSALRGTEIVADPTSVLALECARRLGQDPGAVIRLATSHRCVRAQELPRQKGMARHFRMFALATGGRERKDHGLLVSSLVEHACAHLRALEALEKDGYAFGNRTLSLLATDARTAVADRVADSFPGVSVVRARLDHPYYDGIRFTIRVGDEGGAIPLVDGGAFDWLSRITSNRKLTFAASAMGSQLAASVFRTRADQAPP